MYTISIIYTSRYYACKKSLCITQKHEEDHTWTRVYGTERKNWWSKVEVTPAYSILLRFSSSRPSSIILRAKKEKQERLYKIETGSKGTDWKETLSYTNLFI